MNMIEDLILALKVIVECPNCKNCRETAEVLISLLEDKLILNDGLEE